MNSGLFKMLSTNYLFTRPIYLIIYIYISIISSQCPRTVGVDYSLHRIYEGNHINL